MFTTRLQYVYVLNQMVTRAVIKKPIEATIVVGVPYVKKLVETPPKTRPTETQDSKVLSVAK